MGNFQLQSKRQRRDLRRHTKTKKAKTYVTPEDCSWMAAWPVWSLETGSPEFVQECVNVSTTVQRLARWSHWKADPFSIWSIMAPRGDHEIFQLPTVSLCTYGEWQTEQIKQPNLYISLLWVWLLGVSLHVPAKLSFKPEEGRPTYHGDLPEHKSGQQRFGECENRGQTYKGLSFRREI